MFDITTKSHKLLIFIIIAFNLIIYYPVYTTGFIYEDFVFISCSNRAILHEYVDSFLHLTGDKPPHVNPRPLIRFIWLIAKKLFGFDNTLAFHLMNIFLHISNMILLYFLVCRFSKDKSLAFLSSIICSSFSCNATTLSWLVCGWYPLCSIFMILSIFVLDKLKTSKYKISLYFLLVLVCFAAFSTNEVALVLPLILIIYDFVTYGNWDKLQIFRITVFHLPIFTIDAFLFMNSKIMGFNPTIPFNFLSNPTIPFPGLKGFLEHILGAGLQFTYYIKTLVAPFKFTFIFLIIYLLLRNHNYKKLYFFIVWFVLTFLVTFPLCQMGSTNEILNSRVNYIPSVAFSVILAYLLIFELKSKNHKISRLNIMLEFLIYGAFFWFFLTLKILIPLLLIIVLLLVKRFIHSKDGESNILGCKPLKFLHIAIILFFLLIQSYQLVQNANLIKSISEKPTMEKWQFLLKIGENRKPFDPIAMRLSPIESISEFNKIMIYRISEFDEEKH
jgi:hypothetical protein